MRRFTLITILLLSSKLIFAQEVNELKVLGSNVFKALAENNEEMFLAAFPTFEDITAFLKQSGEQMSDEEAKGIVEQLRTKARQNFTELTEKAQQQGVSWADMELLGVRHDPVGEFGERINVYVGLSLNGSELTLKLDDVMQMKENEWRVTDEVSVGAGPTSGEEPAAEETSYEVSNAQVIQMIEYLVTSLPDYTARDVSDEIVQSTSFVPSTGQVDEQVFEPFFNSPEDRFEIGFNESGTVIEEEEIWFNELSFKMEYWDFPGWQHAGAFLTIQSVKDKDGNNLLLEENKLNEYYDMGLLEQPENYGGVAEMETLVWLNRYLEPEETLQIEGELIWSYTNAYNAVSFARNEIGSTKPFKGMAITLKDIDRNLVQLEIVNDQRFSDLPKLFVNGQGQQFQYYSSTSVPTYIYEEVLANNYSINEEQMSMLVEQFEMRANVPSTSLFQVSGNVDKVVIYETTGSAEKTIPFSMTFSQ